VASPAKMRFVLRGITTNSSLSHIECLTTLHLATDIPQLATVHILGVIQCYVSYTGNLLIMTFLSSCVCLCTPQYKGSVTLVSFLSPQSAEISKVESRWCLTCKFTAFHRTLPIAAPAAFATTHQDHIARFLRLF